MESRDIGSKGEQKPLIQIGLDTPTDPGKSPQTPPEPAVSGFKDMMGKMADAMKKGRYEGRVCIRLLDWLVAFTKRFCTAPRFETTAEWSVTIGHYGLALAQILCVLTGIIAAIKLESKDYAWTGIGMAALLIILQYTAGRFLNAGDAMVKSSPSRLGSIAFLDCLALLTEAAGLWMLIRGVAEFEVGSIFYGLGVWLLCSAVAYVALNPGLANVSAAKDVSAGEEAIGIMSFLVKAVVLIVPIAFGVGAVVGAVGMGVALVPLIRNSEITGSMKSLSLAVFCSCLPFATYVLFAFYHLAIDLMRAVLSVPGKLDLLAGKKG